MGIAKVFKDQLNVINNSREDGEIIDNVNYRYIGDKYKGLNNTIYNYGLKEKDLHLMGTDNWTMGLKNIINGYLKEKDIDVIEKEFDFNKSVKNVPTYGWQNKLQKITNPKQKLKLKTRKVPLVFSTKWDTIYLIFDLDPNTIVELHKNINIIK